MVVEAGKGELARPGVRRIVGGEGGGIRIVKEVGKDERRKLLAASNKAPVPNVPDPRDDATRACRARRLHEEISIASLGGQPSGSEDSTAGKPYSYRGYAGRQPTWEERAMNLILRKFPFLKRFVPEKEKRI